MLVKNKPLILVTRKSALAIWQAEYVKKKILMHDKSLTIDIHAIQTSGDVFFKTSLSKIGGKGLFIKELEQYILTGKANFAVHSMKDVPAELPEGLAITCMLERKNPTDALLSKKYCKLEDLPSNAVVGTSSLRRKAQLLALRSDLEIQPLRGNINTRVQKLHNGEFHAIVLASAGIERLGLTGIDINQFEIDSMLPAVGQGALGVECRVNDHFIHGLLSELNHKSIWQCVCAEREMNRLLNGGCQAPIGGFARITESGQLELRGLVATPDGKQLLKSTNSGKPKNFKLIGQFVGQNLIEQGAMEIMDVLRCEDN